MVYFYDIALCHAESVNNFNIFLYSINYDDTYGKSNFYFFLGNTVTQTETKLDIFTIEQNARPKEVTVPEIIMSKSTILFCKTGE